MDYLGVCSPISILFMCIHPLQSISIKDFQLPMTAFTTFIHSVIWLVLGNDLVALTVSAIL